MVPINEGAPLAVGQVVSYGDMANPRQRAVVVGEPEANGQPVVFTESYHRGHVSQVVINAPGGWQLEDETTTPLDVERLKETAATTQAAASRQREERQQEASKQEAQGRETLEAIRPPWAQAVIVAEHRIDQSDMMTDYHGSTTDQVLLLGWSKSKRDAFGEMRKAAGNAEETAHLVNAGKDAEHREKYSMGAGYYLKDGWRDATGWEVRKLRVYQGRLDSGLCRAAADPANIRLTPVRVNA